MTGPWACRLPVSAASSVGGLRGRFVGIRAGEEDTSLWLHGEELSVDLHQALRALPDAELFSVLPDRQLLRLGQLVPQGRVPALHWQPLQEYIRPTLPSPGLAGRLNERIVLSLVRSSCEAEPNLLLLPFSEFALWCETAPEFRLKPLRFAVRDDGLTIVQGHPLPPLPGTRWVAEQGVAVAAGLRWEPSVKAELLVDMWELEPGDVCLWFEEGSVECIPGEQFVACQRSAIRATRDELMSSEAKR
ncbi:hypothetical protein [Planctomicrobium piriforme]|uniref:MoxR-vWA-beta-propeller ternary system domain-containing protein n=1 Tax=Planctomicrobium piriforme TaxID=1576369 RepID=A0A1I3E1P2_9PLAN|nr:hypothetical protein [Planctomicrobium piriforme]SFH92904.1 hypothetical protein SAMN05421753_10443 [Planctomicrobium piriforme]